MNKIFVIVLKFSDVYNRSWNYQLPKQSTLRSLWNSTFQQKIEYPILISYYLTWNLDFSTLLLSCWRYSVVSGYISMVSRKHWIVISTLKYCKTIFFFKSFDQKSTCFWKINLFMTFEESGDRAHKLFVFDSLFVFNFFPDYYFIKIIQLPVIFKFSHSKRNQTIN